MNQKYRRSAVSLALAASFLGTAAWSPASHACAVEVYMSSICIMAWPKNSAFGGGTYQAAAGQTLSVSQNQALYSLIGNTYGGSYPNTFALPDLRGRTIIGAGQGIGLPFYNYGDKGGNFSVTLSLAQLPVHNHLLGTGVTVSSGPGNLTANTTIGTLAANTTIGNLAAVSTLSGLSATLKASPGPAAVPSPAGAALATYLAPSKIYSNTAPDTAMNAGSIVMNGSVTTSLTGAPATTLSGNPSTTLTGAPAVAVGGQTNTAGTSAPVAIMPPYLALSYYIAVQGIYPTVD